MNNGNVNNNNKTNTNRVRPVAPVAESATIPVVYDIPFSSVIEAWIDCEREKRSSNSCTKFRWHAARDLVELWEQMRTAKYKPKASMVFMVTHPVLREVWAGAFRDRVAHHWEHLRYQPVLEQYFIYAGDRSMNCRKGYGALRAIETFNKAIYDFTEGYTRDDCYIVGGDFANFFMSVDKPLLWPLLEELMAKAYSRPDLQAVLYMMRTTLFHRCQDNYFKRSSDDMWDGLPPRKSLFYMDGMPIGNLPSQNWANFLGAVATIYAVFHLKISGFLIFVDDWRGLVRSLDEGRRVIEDFRRFLAEDLHITLHPDKIYLQHYTKGTKMVGAVIKPPCNLPRPVNRVKSLCKWLSRGFSQAPIHIKKFKSFLLSGLNSQSTRKPSQGRVYIANRTRGHFIESMRRFKVRAEATDDAGRIKMLEELRASVNSYLGMMVHFNSYKIRRRIAEEWILPTWGKYIYFIEDFSVMKIRNEFDEKFLLRRRLKRRKFAAKFIRPKWSPN